MLATTRWGSYIGVSPLFLTDILVAGAVVRILLASPRHRVRQPTFSGWTGLLAVFLAYVVIRMATSTGWVFTQTWLRDGAPYLYGVLGLMSAAAISRSTSEERQRTMTWIWRALIFHLIWVACVGGLGHNAFLEHPRPFLGNGIFALRPDVDTAIVGVTAALLLRRVLIGQSRGRALIGLLLVAVTLLNVVTRAGFIAVLVCAVVGFGAAYAASHGSGLRRAGMVLAVPLVIIAGVEAVPATKAGARLMATIQPSDAMTTGQANALGTSHARQLVWSGVINWTLADRSRATFGTGMGPDFLAESNTLQYLEGTTYTGVRSPHDYFVGSMARLGLVGLALIVALIVRLMRQVLRYRRRIAHDELLTAATLIVAAVVTVASFGVVLEAPFGAVPFWWSAGLLLALSGSVKSDDLDQDTKTGEPGDAALTVTRRG
jgi:O-antigen ligase